MADDFQAKPRHWSAERPSAYDRYSEVNLRRPERQRSGVPWVVIAAVAAFGLMGFLAFGMLMSSAAPRRVGTPAPMAAGSISARPDVVVLPREEEVFSLEGTWIATAAVIDGDQATDNALANVKLTMDPTGFKLVLAATQKKGRSWTIKTDDLKDSETPTHKIDFVLEDGSRMEGIFTLDGDTMKLCLSQDDEPRPTDFSASEYSKRILLTLKRQKQPTRKC
jgi:uncharacterized protein (TIGR03067 family)